MKTKTFIILVVILAVLVGIGIALFPSSETPVGNETMGTLIFENLPANEITTIIIDLPDDSVTMVKKQDKWVVKNRFGYPADFSKITDLIRQLKQTKAGRKFPETPSVKKRLSLMSPADKDAAKEEKATRIRMKDQGETLVADVLLGGTRNNDEKGMPDSQYVMPKGTDIYLVDRIFSSFETAAPSWLNKNPVNVVAEDIRRIASVGPDGTLRYAFERPEKGKPLVLVSPPTSGKIKPSAVNRLAAALKGLEIKDVADPSSPPESLSNGVSARIDYTLFNGITYRVFPGITCSPGIPCYLRLHVAYNAPAEPKETDTLKTEPEKKEPTPDENQDQWVMKAKELNAHLSPWIFIVPQWQHQAFFIALDEMLEKEKTKDVPQT